MKKLILTAGALICAVSVFAQGTVVFNNAINNVIKTHVYSGSVAKAGNGTADYPTGTTDWTGFTALTGSGWSAVLIAANGGNQPESSLTVGANPTVTSFRSGVNAGFVALTTATLNQVPADAPLATLQLFVWDNKAGGTDAATALTAFRAAIAAGRGAADFYAGLSPAFTLGPIGGVGSPPNLIGLQSFSIVPEPSSMALAGLAAASLLIFRRRK